MVRYTLPQSPETILTVKGKDSAKAREEAMDQLMQLIDSDKLSTELKEGFGPKQFVEVKDIEDGTSETEDAITEAIQILSNLASLKLKVMESREEALKIRAAIDILFTDEPVTAEEISSLKDGFKVLKNFAQANVRYREARGKAESARAILDEALQSPESENKAQKSAK